jgi:hypothetical protein
MRIPPTLLAFLMLILLEESVRHGIQAGHLMVNLPEIVIYSLTAGILGWRAWKTENDKQFSEVQAKLDSLPWHEAIATAKMFFCCCIVLFVPLIAIASLHPETFGQLDYKTMLVFPLYVAPVCAVLAGICRFFWWR